MWHFYYHRFALVCDLKMYFSLTAELFYLQTDNNWEVHSLDYGHRLCICFCLRKKNWFAECVLMGEPPPCGAIVFWQRGEFLSVNTMISIGTDQVIKPNRLFVQKSIKIDFWTTSLPKDGSKFSQLNFDPSMAGLLRNQKRELFGVEVK